MLKYNLSFYFIASLLICSSFAKLPKYNIKYKEITVGGLSSGGFMAVQMHFAFSKTIKGASIVAGGPFWCSQGNAQIAVNSCMNNPGFINVSILNEMAYTLAAANLIDSLSNLKGSKIYLFSGLLDSVVKQGVVRQLQKQYESLGAIIKTVYDIPAQHAYITKRYGNSCSFAGVPYINICDYNMAFEALSTLYGELEPAIEEKIENLIEFDQANYTSFGYSMEKIGFVYVPTNCKSGLIPCRLSIQFHGCLQTLNDVGLDFVTKLGINGVAEANDIIILYPQVKASTINPQNPNGCWDWYSYTENVVNNTSYVTKKSKQMSAVWKMVTDLVGANPETLQTNPEVLQINNLIE